MRRISVELMCIIIAVILILALDAGAASYLPAKYNNDKNTSNTYLLAASRYGGAEKSTQEKDTSIIISHAFKNPTYNGMPVDASLTDKTTPGKAAANKFCNQNSYSAAKSWEITIINGTVSPTIRLGDGTICKQRSCNRFASIECQ
jgi:hypothetical protein